VISRSVDQTPVADQPFLLLSETQLLAKTKSIQVIPIFLLILGFLKIESIKYYSFL